MSDSPYIAAKGTAPATTPTQQNLAAQGSGCLDHMVIAPASAEPLFLHLWDGVGASFSASTTKDTIPILDGTNLVVIGQRFPAGATWRITTDSAGNTGPAAAKAVSFRWR